MPDAARVPIPPMAVTDAAMAHLHQGLGHALEVYRSRTIGSLTVVDGVGEQGGVGHQSLVVDLALDGRLDGLRASRKGSSSMRCDSKDAIPLDAVPRELEGGVQLMAAEGEGALAVDHDVSTQAPGEPVELSTKLLFRLGDCELRDDLKGDEDEGHRVDQDLEPRGDSQ